MSVTEDTLHSLAVDYLTATARDRDAGAKLHSYASGLFRWEAETGNTPRPWSGSGFSGWQCGQVQISTRDVEVMVRLSGDAAARWWRKTAELSENVSRIDLQGTIIIPGDVTRRIDRHRREALRFSKKLKYVPIVRWIQDARGGYTLYLGSRESYVFGRIYDKWQRDQLDHFKGCVRFEAQFQRKLALNISRSLLSTSSPMPRIASHVSQFFTGRGVGLELPYDDSATYCCSRPRTDDGKTLEWLATAVRPSILRLIDAGKGLEVFRALGLISDGDGDLDHVLETTTIQ